MLAQREIFLLSLEKWGSWFSKEDLPLPISALSRPLDVPFISLWPTPSIPHLFIHLTKIYHVST